MKYQCTASIVSLAVSVSAIIFPGTSVNASPQEPDRALIKRLDAACAELKKLNTKVAACADGAAPSSAITQAPKGAAPKRLGNQNSLATAERLGGGPIVKAPATPSPLFGATDGSPFFLLRQDQYDEVSYITGPDPGQVIQGASVSYTKDQLASSQTAQIKGLAGISAFNGYTSSVGSCDAQSGYLSRTHDSPLLAGYGFGAFVLGDGNYTQPMMKTERSALREGPSADFLFCNAPIVPYQEVQLMPYFQTDFRGKASIAGFDSIWEPTDANILLGGRTDVYAPKQIAGYYFRLYGEANVFRVGEAGLTNFKSHTDYAFLGGAAEVRAVLFENNPNVPAALCGRIALIGTSRYLWNEVSQKPIYLYGAEVDYNLFGQNASTAKCKGSFEQVASGGSGSIGFSYNRGTDPTTLVDQKVYKVTFKLSY
jgi:hypothetical protein